MEENEKTYLKAREAELAARKQPSKDHEQPIVVNDPESGQPIYREQM